MQNRCCAESRQNTQNGKRAFYPSQNQAINHRSLVKTVTYGVGLPIKNQILPEFYPIRGARLQHNTSKKQANQYLYKYKAVEMASEAAVKRSLQSIGNMFSGSKTRSRCGRYNSKIYPMKHYLRESKPVYGKLKNVQP